MFSITARPKFHPIPRDHHTAIAEQVCAMRYEASAPVQPPYRKLQGHRIGELSVARYDSRGIEHGRRTMEHIRAEASDYFLLCLPVQARLHFSHVGLESDIESGSAVLLTARHPFDAYIDGDVSEGLHSSLQVRIPGPLLRGRLPVADQLCNRPISVAAGAGAIMQSLIETSLRQAHVLTAVQALRQSHLVADAISNAMLAFGDDDGEAFPPAERKNQWRFDRAMAYIAGHLSAPDLDVARISAYCKVSQRYLHKIFAERSLTVAGAVREARLQACRQALRCPELSSRSVIDIACTWGFNDASHFGRIYKKRFGILPSLERPQR